MLALAAGVVHLGQVGVHLEEGWGIGGFFAVVGVVQVAAAILLLQPRPRSWFWIGITGSAAVIGIWVASRTVGLPFVEGGEVEVLGVADTFASLLEAWTILLLGLHLAGLRDRSRLWLPALAASAVLGSALLWLSIAGRGLFDDDPARMAASQPTMIDLLVAAAATALAGGLVFSALAPAQQGPLRGLARGFLAATAVAAGAVTWLVFPPTIGQNLDCEYAPISTVLPGGHELEPERVPVAAGQELVLPVLELRTCENERDISLHAVEPLSTMGDGATLDGFWLLPTGVDADPTGLAALPDGALAVPPGDRIRPGAPRLLVARIVGTGDGDFSLASVRLRYAAGETGSIGFGAAVAVCSGSCDAD